MPRVFTIEMLDEQLDDDDYDETSDPFEASPDAFQYIAAPEFGPAGPVRVAVNAEQAGKIDNGPDAYERYAGKRVQSSHDEWVRKAEAEAARFAEAMVALGAARAYARYDGGNDEGFAWFDHCVMRDGSTRDADQIAKDLESAGVTPNMEPFGDRSPTRNALDDLVAITWSVQLLGQGYGTGEYVMYGAFSVDLQTGLVTDDPDPAPVVQNIKFKAQ